MRPGMRKLISIVLAFAFVLSPLLARADDPPPWVIVSQQEARERERERELVNAQRLEHAGMALSVLGTVAGATAILTSVLSIFSDGCFAVLSTPPEECTRLGNASIGLGVISAATVTPGIPMWWVGAARAKRLKRVAIQPTASGVIIHF